MSHKLYFLDTKKFDKALLQLSKSAVELTRIAKELKDSTKDSKGFLDQVKGEIAIEPEQELCPQCETPLIVKRERGEIPGQSREYAFCRGCGYTEA